MDKQRAFLGRGWSFPPTFSQATRSIEMVETDQDIRESLIILLSTSIGERLFRPDYGSDLDRMVFEKMTETTKNNIISIVSKAIFNFEPRIKLEAVEVTFEESTAFINIQYTVISTNVRTNIVYPFYFVEGTHIDSV